jgi:archaellin
VLVLQGLIVSIAAVIVAAVSRHVAITSSDPSQQVGPVTNPSLGIYQATITSTSTPG